LLDEGKAVYDNSADQVVRQYLAGMQKLAEISLDHRVDRSGDGSIKITGIRIGTVEERGLGKWVTGKDCMLELDFICYPDRIFHNVEIAVGIRRQDESKILYLGSKVTHQDFETLSGSGTILCVVPRLPLEPAQLFFNTEINCNGIIVDYVNRAATLEVAEGDFYGTGVLWPSGGFLCDYDWSLKQ
jgi:lipopolysaccharide transport system ATP-binding protein